MKSFSRREMLKASITGSAYVYRFWKQGYHPTRGSGKAAEIN
jgi:hypothetical protein